MITAEKGLLLRAGRRRVHTRGKALLSTRMRYAAAWPEESHEERKGIKMDHNKLREYSRAAQGLDQADLVLKNARIADVFCGAFFQGDVAVCGETIVGVGQYEGRTEVDLTGKTLCPGFIDSHLHLESTLVSPGQLICNAAAFGTTTFIVDPHESANVAGGAGIDYILEQTERAPANVYVMLPSCVPAAPGEDNGCVFTAAQMARYLGHPRVLGLGEVMDCPAVLSGAPDMLDKLDLFRDKNIDGHAPGLTDRALCAYALAGIETDHECCDFEYARRERRNGLQIHVREGTAAKNLEAIVSGLVREGMDTTGFSFCTDDKHIEEIRREGHISFCVKKAVSLGLPAVKAIQMATINAARCYGLRRLGAVAPGYQADFVILDDVETMDIAAVYHKGRLISRRGVVPESQRLPCPESLRGTVRLAPLSPESLRLPIGEGPQPVIELLPHQIVTERAECPLPRREGCFLPNAEFNKLAAVERHRATGRIGVGVVRGFGVRDGAIASSVSHDSHNIIVVGDNDADMLRAVEELARVQGGYAIVSGGRVLAVLPLPVMGLMSEEPSDAVNERLASMLQIAHRMGVCPDIDPFITLSFLALPVIPRLRITTRGLLDVVEGRILSME